MTQVSNQIVPFSCCSIPFSSLRLLKILCLFDFYFLFFCISVFFYPYFLFRLYVFFVGIYLYIHVFSFQQGKLTTTARTLRSSPPRTWGSCSWQRLSKAPTRRGTTHRRLCRGRRKERKTCKNTDAKHHPGQQQVEVCTVGGPTNLFIVFMPILS